MTDTIRSTTVTHSFAPLGLFSFAFNVLRSVIMSCGPFPDHTETTVAGLLAKIPLRLVADPVDRRRVRQLVQEVPSVRKMLALPAKPP